MKEKQRVDDEKVIESLKEETRELKASIMSLNEKKKQVIEE